MSPTKTWKKNELSWAKIGAKRNHFEAEDCSHPLFSIECKHRSIQNYPKTLRGWFEQAKANAAQGKIPLLAIHLAGELRANDLVVMRRSDFEDLLGRMTGENSRETARPEAIITLKVCNPTHGEIEAPGEPPGESGGS